MYSAKIDGEPTTFGTSGMLYRSNKLMYDRKTESLWSQLTGEPVVGPLVGAGLRLEFFASELTTWAQWVADHPGTTVISNETGVYPADFYVPESDPAAIYYEYFNSAETMFPVPRRSGSLEAKQVVLALRVGEASKAYPVEAVQAERVINDAVGGRAVVIIGSATSEGARVYERGTQTFTLDPAAGGRRELPRTLAGGGGRGWRVEEEALISEDGERLARIPTHMAFWHGWFTFHPDTDLYEAPQR